ncbi:hypothetical protein E4T56_gene1615 [Termitomyces sp. T112]|nr:hypothetical protein E4T56_gene1615 [Termitomyces sp. T112]
MMTFKLQAPDMQMTIKEEETERRSGRKKRITEGRQRQLNLGGIGLKGKKVKEDPSKIDDFEIVRSKADAARQDIIRAKEEEWVQRGGRVKDWDDGATSVQEVSKLYIEKGLNLPGGGTDNMENDDDDDDDDDSDIPELSARLRGSASPFPTHGSEDGNEDVDEENNTVDTADLNPEDGESDAGLLSRTCRAVLKAIVDSDDEDIAPRPNFSPRLQDSPFNDHGIKNDEDKENETCRMFDRGGDKENKAVVRRVPLDEKVPSETKKSFLLGLESGLVRRLSLSPAHPEDDDNVTMNEVIDDDPFVFPSRPSRLPKSFDIRLKPTSPIATQPSTSPLNLTPFIGAKFKCLVFSQFHDEHSVGVGPAPLQPGFSDFFEFGTEKQNAAISPERLTGGLADKAFPRDKLAKADTLDLIQDITLEPAFEVSGMFLRKADQIFEKEQEYVLEAANQKVQPEPELYVNDHGQASFNFYKSEFVEQEAQESDEDEIFGFGPRQKDNDDEEDGEYLDQTLEILVDDSEMDEKTVAANLVLEKFQEHGKDDDETLQRLHEAAIKGELRKKRKNRGFMNDSDDESDEDERDRH